MASFSAYRRPFISLSLHYAKLKMTRQTKFERYRADLVWMVEGGCQERDGEADRFIRADGSEVFEYD